MEFLAELHPLIVHFPIALLVCYCILEVISIFVHRNFIADAALLLLALGVLTSLGALLTGNQAAIQAEQLQKLAVQSHINLPAHLITDHQDWATTAIWFFTTLLILRVMFTIETRIKQKHTEYITKAKLIFAVLALGGFIFIYHTGLSGGTLVFQKGFGTELLKQNINQQGH